LPAAGARAAAAAVAASSRSPADVCARARRARPLSSISPFLQATTLLDKPSFSTPLTPRRPLAQRGSKSLLSGRRRPSLVETYPALSPLPACFRQRASEVLSRHQVRPPIDRLCRARLSVAPSLSGGERSGERAAARKPPFSPPFLSLPIVALTILGLPLPNKGLKDIRRHLWNRIAPKAGHRQLRATNTSFFFSLRARAARSLARRRRPRSLSSLTHLLRRPLSNNQK
jgi:hypothetical protein